MAKRIDLVTVGVLWNRLLSIVDEGTVTLKRTAFSRVVTEADDFSNALFDARGAMIAQPSQGEVAFIGCMATEVGKFLERFPPPTLKPGDVLICNDPWLGTSQLNDYTVVTPIFHRRRLVGFAANISHSPDVGGRVLSGDSTEIFEEGFRIPMTRLFRASRPNEDLLAFIRANVRIPEVVVGDLMAQVTSNAIVRDRVVALLRETGLADLQALGGEILRRSERAMRAVIAKLPPGTYRGEVEGDGDAEPVTIRVAVEVRGDRIRVDFSGTSPQTPRGSNVASNWTYADSVYPILCALRPESPINAGSLRPLEVHAPPGCVLNAQPPAALGARIMVSHYIHPAIYRALAPILPDRVIADCAAPMWVPNVAGRDQYGRRFVDILFMHGGLGGRPTKDGLVVAYPSHPPTTPVELLENEKPFLVERKEFIPDSAGAGRWRGGFGQFYTIRIEGEAPVKLALRVDRIHHPPQGFFGGRAARAGSVTLNGTRPLPSKETVFLRPGDVVHFQTPGGGGYGDPAERDPALIRQDLDNELVSPEAAARDYAAVPDGVPTLTL